MLVCRSCCGTVITHHVTGCGVLPLGGVLIEYKTGSTVIASGTTGDGTGGTTLGEAVISVPGGTYTLVYTKTGLLTITTSATVTGSATVSRNLSAATGYKCIDSCADPFPDVGHLTSVFGTTALTYDAAVSAAAGPTYHIWQACQAMPGGATGDNTINCFAGSGNSWIGWTFIGAAGGATPHGLGRFTPTCCAPAGGPFTIVRIRAANCPAGPPYGFQFSSAMSALTVVSCDPILFTVTYPGTIVVGCPPAITITDPAAGLVSIFP